MTFRGLLESREKEGLTELYSTFVRIEKHAEGSWLSLLGADPYSSYTGIPHIRGVERNVDEAVPEEIKKKFNSTEIFILLASILCHDIGKFVNLNEINPKIIDPSHGQLSCMYILAKWPSLMIPREDLAKGIAIVCCSHVWKSPIRDVECPAAKYCSYQCIGNELSYLDNGLDSDDGYVRLRWLACLLRLADEVDNHLRRAVPKDFVKPNKDNDKESWRRHITGIVFDTSGKCIRLRTPKYIDSDWTEEDKKWGRGHALRAIQEVLDEWGYLLHEIGLDFEKVFLDASLPYPVLLPPTEDKFVNSICFVPEPGLDPDTFDYVRRAIRQLTNSMIGKEDYFTWEALAEESHRDVRLVRLAVNRLVSIHKWPKEKYPEILKAISNDYPIGTATRKIESGKLVNKIAPKKAKRKAANFISNKLKKKGIIKKNKKTNIKVTKNVRQFIKIRVQHFLELENLQISDFGWKINFEKDDSKLLIERVEDCERVIPCIDVLCDLLSPDIKTDEYEFEASYSKRGRSKKYYKYTGYDNKNVHGFCARTTENGKWIAPIIAIEGSSGEGKSTLSLQIANKLANENWICLYYSLEQQSDQLLEILNGYNFFENEENNGKRDVSRSLCETFSENNWYSLDTSEKKLIFPKVTPRPVGKDIDNFSIFETRYREIQQSLDYICAHRKDKNRPPKCIYIIDSLTAFSNQPLSRGQIHRLFELFRQHDVPLIITLERQRHWVNNLEEDHFNIARYLADILINLDSQHTAGYFHQTIEVTKSRYSRRVLGKHLMKIKSTGQKSSGQFDRRVGIAIYPSIHLHLVNSRLDNRKDIEGTNHEQDGIYDVNKHQLFKGINSNLLPISQTVEKEKDKESVTTIELEKETIPVFRRGTCIVIHGIPGGHKFALAMNVLMSIRPNQNDFGHKLIISLAEENEIQLDRVALFDYFTTEGEEQEKINNREDIRLHLSKSDEEEEPRGSKISIRYFGEKLLINGERQKKVDPIRRTVTVLNFRLGKIMPEEFLFILEEFLKENQRKSELGEEKKIDTILFSDTVQLRTCFPLLFQEELFLPTLVDFIKFRDLTSIFIDVHDEDGHPDESLLGAADCRICVSKKISKIKCDELEEIKQERAKENNQDEPVETDLYTSLKNKKLLLNTIQVDNILGKSYDRNLRYVVAKYEDSPLLFISDIEVEAKKDWCIHKENVMNDKPLNS